MPIAMCWVDRILWIRLLGSLELLLMIDGLSTTTPHVSGNESSEVTLICNRDGGPAAAVLWEFHAMLHPTSDNDKVNIAEVSHSGLFMPNSYTAWADDISSTGNSHLVIHRLRLGRDEGYFMCALGVESITIEVTVLVPVQTVAMNPAGTATLRTTQADATTFTCTATSKPVVAVTWERVNSEGAVILSGATARETIIEDLTQVISSLSYIPQKEHNGERIRCSAMNTAMTRAVVSSDTNLLIYYPPDYVRTISDYTTPVTESSTESLHLTCRVNGVPNPNILIYTWSSDCGTGVRNGSQISVPRNRTMNNKQCYCTVTHSETSWNQSSPHVEFNITYAPDVTVSVVSSPVTEGGNTQLECHPSAVPDIYTYIAWTHIVNGVRVREFTGSRSLNLNNVTFENSGEYRCTVNNTVGTGTGSGSVTIKYASKLVEVGNFSAGMNDTATLSLKFIGDPRPNVTWYKDGSNSALPANVIKISTKIVQINVSWIFYKTPVTIPGYEATLTIHSVQEQDYTAYHATLDNGLKTDSLIPCFSAHLIRNVPKQAQEFVDTINEVAIAAGVAVPVAIIIAVVAAVVIVRLRRQKSSKANKRESSEMNVGSPNIVNDNTGFIDIPLDIGAYADSTGLCNITVNITNQQNNNVVGPLYADVDKSKKSKKLTSPGPLYADVDKSKQSKKLVVPGIDYEDVAMSETDRTVNHDTSNETYENTENEAKKQNTRLADVAYETGGELQQRIQEQQSHAPPHHTQGMIYADLALVDVKENNPPSPSGRLQEPAGKPKRPTKPVTPVSLMRKEEATVYASIDHVSTANHKENLH